jgi:glycosidase
MTALKREFPQLTVVGEVWDGNPALVSFFEGGRLQPDGIDDKVDYLFDFPLFYPIRRAFAEGHSVRDVAQMLSHDRLYRDPSHLMTFLGLHDVPRFMSEPGASPAGLKLGFTFLLTTRGIPLIYYGDEIGMLGGGDPDNRRDFPGGWAGERNAFESAGRTRDEQEIFEHVQKLLSLRAAHPDLRGRQTQVVVADEQTLVYRRGRTLVAIDNDTTAVKVRVPGIVPETILLGACQASRVERSTVEISIPGRVGCIFGDR